MYTLNFIFVSVFELSTLVSKIGVRETVFLGSGLVLLNYGVGILAAIYMPQVFRRIVMIPAHIILVLYMIFQFQAWVLEQANYTKKAALRFYRFIWNLFYTEFLIYPFM
ncbi:hypothetical protein JRO89_XS07G0299000 [Xanthoceras sorbifolium]|uniref:Uncharacterized protein n=1 Tax=Xanthoceras sorbifolium TaxID=99658 RepID=A0ABQ8HVR2_9ROSI|nr:hypothetical protein JRO89_XS07G0299000 [Xanthoceras sorbifolium]